jgi:predicted phosphodiesterase
MKHINWIHISDLHFRESENYDQKVVTDSIIQDLKETIEKDGRIIDLIFITGDLTYSGKVEEFAIFHKFLEKLILVTSVSINDIVVVPGNHDVNWNDVPFLLKEASNLINSREQVSQIMGSLEERKNFLIGLNNYNNYIKSTFPWASKTEDSFYHTINYEINEVKIAVLALNSAWLSSPKSNNKGNLVLGERQVREALEKIDNPNIVISLMHHSFEWLKWFDRKDVKGMLDRRADFILSGHEHIEDIFQKVSNLSDVFYVSAGSLYDSRIYTNTYNIIELDLEAGQSNIEIRQYTDSNGGFWTKASSILSDNSFVLPERLIESSTTNETFQKLKKDISYQSEKATNKTTLPKVPRDLIKKIINNDCLLFAGAGTSIDAGLPTWYELLLSLIEKAQEMGEFEEEEETEIKYLLENYEFIVVAEACRKKLGLFEFSNIIKKYLAVKGRNSTIQKILSEIPFAGCLTTNYDSFVELNNKNSRVILPKELNELSAMEINSIMESSFPILKLHGTYDNAKSIVLTHGDYNNLIFNSQNSRYRENLKNIISNKSMFFIGFSFRDPNIDFTLQEVFSNYRGNSVPHYALIPNIGKLKADYFWENYNIKAISLPIEELGWKCLIEYLENLKNETVKSSTPNTQYSQ